MSKTQTYSTDPLGYYKILKSLEDADERALKINYREQAKEWHPDHNSSPQAMENFQKISVAYDILSDEKKRLIYDLAARSHSIENFPDIFSLKILTDMSGKNEANVRCFKIGQVRGRGWGYKYNQEVYICNNEEAKKIIFKNSLLNNLLGWLSIKGFKKNLEVIKQNYQETRPNSYENLRLLIHNSLAYAQEHLYAEAYLSAVQAREYADGKTKELLERFIRELPEVKVNLLQAWNYDELRHIQLYVPLSLGGIILLSLLWFGANKLNLLPQPQADKIEYYQEVRHWRGNKGVDDVVVAKIIDIRSDSNSMNMLYHVKSGYSVKVMYGPSDDFDILTILKNEATVRVTGVSPDKEWYRITLDNGDMGFVHSKDLSEGIGAPVPQNSQVYTGK